jgi:large subunit ribosomal protein L10
VNRDQKQEFVADLHQTLGGVQTVVVAHYKGLTVAELNALRAKMADVGASFRVTKNRLTRLALEGTNFTGLSDLFTGPTGIAISEDPVAAAKAAVEFAKGNDKFVILGGAMNETTLDVNGVKSLASMPSLDELRATLVGMISTPATRIAGVLQAPAGQVARVIGAYASKGEEAA